LRDRALLALGFADAFRRSELVALEIGDLVEAPDAQRVTIRCSKTDQEGQGQGSLSGAVTGSAACRGGADLARRSAGADQATPT
jgi:hypothetical protein